MARDPDDTYVKLYRSTLDSDIFGHAGLFQVAAYCLLRATYKPRVVPVATGRGEQLVELQPGELIWGRISAGTKMNQAPKTAERNLLRLENLGFLTRQPTHHYTIVTITNWGSYQNADAEPVHQCDPPMTHQWPTNDHKQEGKERKEPSTPYPQSAPTTTNVADVLEGIGDEIDEMESNGTPTVTELESLAVSLGMDGTTVAQWLTWNFPATEIRNALRICQGKGYHAGQAQSYALGILRRRERDNYPEQAPPATGKPARNFDQERADAEAEAIRRRVAELRRKDQEATHER